MVFDARSIFLEGHIERRARKNQGYARHVRFEQEPLGTKSWFYTKMVVARQIPSNEKRMNDQLLASDQERCHAMSHSQSTRTMKCVHDIMNIDSGLIGQTSQTMSHPLHVGSVVAFNLHWRYLALNSLLKIALLLAYMKVSSVTGGVGIPLLAGRQKLNMAFPDKSIPAVALSCFCIQRTL